MKKHGLFKVLLIVLFLLVVLSYFVPNRTSEIAYLGLGDVFVNSIQSFYYFFDTALFVLAIGGLYGVLNNTSAYKKLLNSIVTKVKPNSKKFVFITIIVFALLTSLTGLTMPLLVFVPFVVSIIILLGYDKLVAFSSTIGAIIIGFIGGIFVTFKDPTSMYSVSFTSFEKFSGLDNMFVNLFPKILLLVAACGLFIYYVNKHIKSVEDKKVKYDLNNDADLLVSEVKGNYKDIKTWPLIIVLAVLLVLLILGFVPWTALNEKFVLFDNFHEWLLGLKIGDFEIFKNVISSNFTAFGQWATLGNYMMIIILILLAVIVIKFICKVKWNDIIDNFIDGCKKMLPVAGLTILAYAVLVCAYNNGFMEQLISSANESMNGLNLAMTSLFTLLGGIVNVDLYYTSVGIFKPILDTFSDETMLPVLAMSFQTLFGFIMLVGPTSLLLIIGLTYLDIPYFTWLKYIWRFLLELFILIFVILLIVTLI